MPDNEIACCPIFHKWTKRHDEEFQLSSALEVSGKKSCKTPEQGASGLQVILRKEAIKSSQAETDTATDQETPSRNLTFKSNHKQRQEKEQ